MNFARTTVSLLLLAAIGTAAQAQSEKTREQVKAEYAEAVRTGDVIPAGDAGLKLNELYPQRYPHAEVAVATTRAQVKAELAEAIRTGDMMASGDSGSSSTKSFRSAIPRSSPSRRRRPATRSTPKPARPSATATCTPPAKA